MRTFHPGLLPCLLSASFLLASQADLLAAKLKVPKDYATIGAAIDAALPGDQVLISEGVYQEALVLPLKTDLRIRGKGKVILDANGADRGIDLGFSTDIVLEGLTVRNAAIDGIRAMTCARITIARCEVQKSSGQGILIAGGTGHLIRETKVVKAEAHGIVLSASASTLEDCRIVDSGQSHGFHAISLLGTDLVCADNRVEDDGVGHGIVAGNGGGTATSSIVIADNFVVDAGDDGIVLDEATACSVVGNRVLRAAADGFDVENDSLYATLVDNESRNAGSEGFEIQTVVGVYLDNVARKSSSNGFLLYGSAAQNTLIGNRSTKNDGYGYYVIGEGNFLSGNQAAKNGVGSFRDDAAPGANTWSANGF